MIKIVSDVLSYTVQLQVTEVSTILTCFSNKRIYYPSTLQLVADILSQVYLVADILFQVYTVADILSQVYKVADILPQV